MIQYYHSSILGCHRISITMQKTKFIRHKCQRFMKKVIIGLLCIPPISLEPHEATKKWFQDDGYLSIRSTIMKWWRKNNATKPIECKHKVIKNDYKNEFIKSLPAPEITSSPCYDNITSIRHYFKGQFRETI